MRKEIAIVMAASVMLPLMPAHAYESTATLALPGVFFGTSAAAPPTGIYMFDRAATFQGNLAGPVTNTIGDKTGFQLATGAVGALFVPGWTFLGATYDAVAVQTFAMSSIGSPFNTQSSGMYNTYINPAELSWKFGDSGFYAKAGLGIYIPTGTQTGANGFGNVGTPYWTFVPQLTFSYFKDGWNLSTTLYQEFNTANRVTGYMTGDIFHAEFTATKKFDRWTIGPVAYYFGQVSDDKSSAFYNFTIQRANRYERLAVGGLLAYDFGPATLTAWGAKDVYTSASGSTAGGAVDRSTTIKGFSAQVGLSYRLWGPDQDTAQPTVRPLLTK